MLGIHSIRLCTSPFRFVHGLLVGIKKVNSRANQWTFVNTEAMTLQVTLGLLLHAKQ